MEIPLVLCKGSYMTFNAKDYMRIRKEHRIMGNLVGLRVGHFYDSTVSGLPAVYTSYEAKILLDEGIARLAKTPSGPTEENRREYEEFLRQQVVEQKRLYHQADNDDFSTKNLVYQVPTECLYRDESQSVESCVSPQPDPLKYAVFRDLWKRKFFITSGHSFGGDFLIYPQDPIIVHASHVVHILERPRKISALEFITVNRLCVGVKKECLFAYLEGDSVKYHNSIWDSVWGK